jgi:hypothetical protein
MFAKSTTRTSHTTIADKTRVRHHLVPQLLGTVVNKGGNEWVTVQWDVIAQSLGTRSGHTEAVYSNNLVVVARPRTVVEIEAQGATEDRKCELRVEWLLGR